MSLDDLITANKAKQGGGSSRDGPRRARSGRGGQGGGDKKGTPVGRGLKINNLSRGISKPARDEKGGKGRGDERSARAAERANGRTVPLKAATGGRQREERPVPAGNVDAPWHRDLYNDRGPDRAPARPAAKLPPAQTGFKLNISNLDYNVSEKDIQELFACIGPLKEAKLHYDISGRSKGSAHVIYNTREDADDAIERFHGAALDGKRMELHLAATSEPVRTLTSGISVTGIGGRAGRGGGQVSGKLAARVTGGSGRMFEQATRGISTGTGGGGGRSGGRARGRGAQRADGNAMEE